MGTKDPSDGHWWLCLALGCLGPRGGRQGFGPWRILPVTALEGLPPKVKGTSFPPAPGRVSLAALCPGDVSLRP